MLAPKRPVSIKHGVGAMLSCLGLPGQNLICVLQRSKDPTPVFVELIVQRERLIRGTRSVILGEDFTARKLFTNEVGLGLCNQQWK